MSSINPCKLPCNTAKSCLAYFHDDTAPLLASLLRVLAEQDIAVQHDWIEVMGAVVGRDSEAVKQGLDCLAAKDNGSEAFFRRLQSPELLCVWPRSELSRERSAAHHTLSRERSNTTSTLHNHPPACAVSLVPHAA
jgi:hypothetical protein